MTVDPAVTRDDTQPTAGSLQFIGNATVLLRYAGFTILTDPNFTGQASRCRWATG